MATFVLIHGGGSSSWDWHLVAPMLQSAGHEAVAVDLPIDNGHAGLHEYVDTVAAVAQDRHAAIVVGHSLGGYTAPLAAERLGARGLVYLAAMVPRPGESFEQWWVNTGHTRETVPEDPYYADVSPELRREAEAHTREQQGEWMSQPWPADGYPAVPTRAILCLDDLLFPAEFMRRQIRERLGIEPYEIRGGHYAAIANPRGVAEALIDFAGQLSDNRGGSPA